ncbi:hypothetical protein SLS55_003040 [Diplodia seriata]|uniref:Uncharacterized protein n=1 Tax=Diplodia seriata TaxID=420778 RepID=A0ABR3CLV6_9PEZI
MSNHVRLTNHLGLDMSTSLAQHHVHCYQAFTRISAEVPVSTAHHDSLQDQFDKYKLWAGNVGAAHSGKTYQLSLDYRLREAPFYKEQACKLLQILARQTNKTADILAGSRTPFEQISSGPESDTTSCTSPVEEDSPWELSSDSEAEVAITSHGKPADQPSSSQSISPPAAAQQHPAMALQFTTPTTPQPNLPWSSQGEQSVAEHEVYNSNAS